MFDVSDEAVLQTFQKKALLLRSSVEVRVGQFLLRSYYKIWGIFDE